MATPFEELGLDSLETKTYLALLEFGPQPAGVLAKKLGAKRSSLYGVIRRLIEAGLVGETVRSNVSIFEAESPEKLKLLFRKKREALDHGEAELNKLLPLLRKRTAGRIVRPKVQIYEGADGLQAVLKDMLLYANLATFAVWPIRNMLDVLTPEFFRYLNKERIRSRLSTRAIWPADQEVDIRHHPYLGVGPEFLREIRIAPNGVEIPMGYWAYGAKVAFISSRSESFGFVVESEELVRTLQAQFDLLWKLSKPVPIERSATRAFLEELRRY